MQAPILMYHSVSDEASSSFRPFTVSPSKFAEQMERLSDRGFKTLTVSQLRRHYDEDLRLPERTVALTFDDGYLDFVEKCLPILARYQFTATVYMVTDVVGGTAHWLEKFGERTRPLMSWRDLALLQGEGIEVGAHGRTHRALDLLDRLSLVSEIRDSKHLLEDRLQNAVESFSYPFGFFSREVTEEVRRAGYKSACSVRYALSSADDGPYDMPRYIVRRGTDSVSFDRMSDGRVAFGTHAWDRLRSKSYASARTLFRGAL